MNEDRSSDLAGVDAGALEHRERLVGLLLGQRHEQRSLGQRRLVVEQELQELGDLELLLERVDACAYTSSGRESGL